LCVGCVVLFDWGVGWVLWVVMVLLGFVAVIRWLVVEVAGPCFVSGVK